ncbi:diadenylate cyclase [Bacillus cereus]|uniref:diadenylate cyclase n=1 Tax=Bacillus cereus TaxID=1396 RepID=UPI0006991168|nr:diadenylate cyclase [Bacillus cereus]
MNTIELFMWGYQAYYQVSVNITAERLFGEINDRLFNQVFVLGILAEHKEQSHPICLQPEPKYCGYTPDFFKDIGNVAKKIFKNHQEKDIMYSDFNMQKQHEMHLKMDSLRLAIEEILNNSEGNSSKISFCTMPSIIEGYYVFTILQLNRNVYETFYKLSKELDSSKRPIQRNLIDSVTNEFLNLCTLSLFKPNKAFSYIDRDENEILRTAGRKLMDTVESGSKGFGGLHQLYDVCHNISSMKYEGEEGKGKLVICKKDHPAVNMLITLKNPVELRNKRATRELLEISTENKYLISDGELVFGLGTIIKSGDLQCDLFVIYFTKHFNFEVYYKENILMQVSYGVPNLPKPKVNKEKFIDAVERFFSGISKQSIENLWSLITKATHQKHGTMIVISEKAKDEANRLSKQSTLISPQQIDANLISVITSIDGAVLIDKDSICYGIGIILDGIASENGDPSRGARYNSAIRYLDYIEQKFEHKTLIIIVSEDGFVDIVPDLMPRIDRGLLPNLINELEKLEKLNKESRDNNFTRDFHQIMDVLIRNEFYLSPEQCDEINRLKKKIQDTLDGLQIMFKKLEPNDKMNDSYFF